jgi:transaldolase
MTTPTARLAAEGVSIWLDDLSRRRILSGNLAELISSREVTGVTTNPTIFQKAISGSSLYDAQFARLMAQLGVEDTYWELVIDDITLQLGQLPTQ